MKSLRLRWVTAASMTPLAIALAAGAANPAGAENAPDLAQVYSMVKGLQERLATLENENRQAKKDVAEARAEARALRQRLSTGSSEARSSGSAAPALVLPSTASSAMAAMPTKAPILQMPDDRWRFFGGADLLYVQPRWSNNPAFQIVSRTAAAGSPFLNSAVTQTDFSHDFNPTVVLSAGVIAPSGMGLRGRYWWLDSSDGFVLNNPPSTSTTSSRSIITPFTTSPAPVGFANPFNETVSIASGLHLKTADLEGIWRTGSGPWTMTMAGGARYASVRQTYGAVQSAPVTGPNPLNASSVFDTGTSWHEISGIGPTIAADTSYATGWNGVSVYGNSRASWIFGSHRENSIEITTSSRPGVADAVNTDTVTSKGDASLPIIEGEAGLEWVSAIAGMDTIVRAGGYGQVWFNTGNAAGAGTNANLALLGFRLSGLVRF
jgi:hypothetical protein